MFSNIIVRGDTKPVLRANFTQIALPGFQHLELGCILMDKIASFWANMDPPDDFGGLWQ